MHRVFLRSLRPIPPITFDQKGAGEFRHTAEQKEELKTLKGNYFEENFDTEAIINLEKNAVVTMENQLQISC